MGRRCPKTGTLQALSCISIRIRNGNICDLNALLLHEQHLHIHTLCHAYLKISTPLSAQYPVSPFKIVSMPSTLVTRTRWNVPFTPHLLTPHLIHLTLCKTLRLHRRIIPKSILLANLLTRHRLRLLPICSFIHCHHDSTAKTKVVLKRRSCSFDETVVGPASAQNVSHWFKNATQ